MTVNSRGIKSSENLTTKISILRAKPIGNKMSRVPYLHVIMKMFTSPSMKLGNRKALIIQDNIRITSGKFISSFSLCLYITDKVKLEPKWPEIAHLI